MTLASFLLVGCLSIPGQGPVVYSDPTIHDGDDWLFSTERINRIDLEVDVAAQEILDSERMMTDPNAWVPARATLDFEYVGQVGLKLRGGSGSFQRFGAKPKLKIDFDRFQDARFHGLKSLSLNNANLDCAYVAEAIGAEVYATAGVPVSRVGYAQLYVNGLDYGLYVVLETQDDCFLDRAFGDDGGNLYDGSYIWAGWLPYFLDFGLDRDEHFDLMEGEDVGFADIADISLGVRRSEDLGRLDGGLQDSVDWDSLQDVLAVEQWLGNEDGYALNTNNYRVFFPEDAPMAFIPWDLEYLFRVPRSEPWRAARSWDDPRGRLAAVCYADPACRRRHAQAALDAADVLDTVDWVGRAVELLDLTREGADGDPRRSCSDDEVAAQRVTLLDWLGSASEGLREAWE